MVIFDTNILIEFYRGNEQTPEAVLALDHASFYVSAITVAEFLVGTRNKQEQLNAKVMLYKALGGGWK